MNINTMIRRIKRDIGIYGIALPIDDVDKMILEILEDTTLPVFSLYCPLEEIQHVDVSYLIHDTDLADGADMYIIPENLIYSRKLLYVKRVAYDESYLRANYFPSRVCMTGLDGLGDLLTANIGKNIIDQTVNSITFKYIHPRKLLIYDALVSSKLTIYMCFEHDKSFASITPTSEESFYNLALLDVKAGLYPTIKHFDGIETALGRIELKIDDWQSASADRKELLADWNETYLLDAVDFDFN